MTGKHAIDATRQDVQRSRRAKAKVDVGEKRNAVNAPRKETKVHEIIGVINRCPVRGSISPPRGGLDGGGSFFAASLEPAAHT